MNRSIKPPTERQVRENRFKALIAVMIVACIVFYPGDAAEARPDAHAAVPSCFPLALWSAAPGARPCNRVTTLEDGSGFLALGTVARTSYRCTIPARDDRPRRGFMVRCKAVPR